MEGKEYISAEASFSPPNNRIDRTRSAAEFDVIWCHTGPLIRESLGGANTEANMTQLLKAQRKVCKEQGVSPDPPHSELKLGISHDFSLQDHPINGLRHPAEEGTSGWFIWSGEELSSDPEFFDPMHVKHIEEKFPEVAKYLALPPGWRFLIAPDHEDIWFDDSLLDI